MTRRATPFPETWMKNADLLIAGGGAVVILMMILPIPAAILDLAIAANITISLMIFLTVMYTVRAIDFSSFPALLLMTTLFRLAINVSATRLILSQGIAFEGKIIRFFGDVVVFGNYTIGIVVFLILIAIQFMVIVKGATRISEVAARFTLDAMPGKQMAIDADLNAGLITEAEAKERRSEIRREADFYGAMDGASKFVQGDVMAGLLITLINIVGGLIIGVWQRGEPIAEAARVYTLLTIGDGLVAQIPSLLISVATGLIVARAASAEANIGREFVNDLTQQPRALYFASGILAVLGIGYLGWPMLVLSAATGALGWRMKKSIAELEVTEKATKKKDAAKDKKPENVAALLAVDPLEIEIGYALIPLVDPEQGGDLLDRITMIRRQMALELGLIVPPIRIRDNMQLKPQQYAIKVKGVEVGGGEVRPDMYLAMNSGNATGDVPGEVTREPAFNLPALWIREENRDKAELGGFIVVDPPAVIATHLTETLKRHAAEILGRQETQQVLDEIKKTYGALVEDATKALSLGEIQKILQNLLTEGIAIRDMVTILETIADKSSAVGKDIERVTDLVRIALARQITKQFKDPEGRLHVITLDPRIEEEVSGAFVETIEGRAVGLEPKRSEEILTRIGREVEKALGTGVTPVMLTSPRARRAVRTFVRRAAPHLVVLSVHEVAADTEIRTVGRIAA